MSESSYVPLHLKYRPCNFNELVGQETISLSLTNAIKTKKIANAYLFAGARGTGKTSSARILAKSLNCLQKDTVQPCGVCQNCVAIDKAVSLDVLEIDAASNTGVDAIRELNERASYMPVNSAYKVIIIDECHMLSKSAMNALLKTLEEPLENVVFVLATTEPHQLLDTITSRCQQFKFKRVSPDAIKDLLVRVCTAEKIRATFGAMNFLANNSQGGVRDALKYLDQLSLLGERIEENHVSEVLGQVAENCLTDMLGAIHNQNLTALLKEVRKQINNTGDVAQVCNDLSKIILNHLLALSPGADELRTVSKDTWELIKNYKTDASIIMARLTIINDAANVLRNTSYKEIYFENVLVELINI